jgi:hypothetical protein
MAQSVWRGILRQYSLYRTEDEKNDEPEILGMLTRSPVRDVMPTPNRQRQQTNEYRTIMGKAYYIKW